MYDYIIIGAGSAGCVLAHRLTEDENTTVLLLEAGGPDDRQEIQIPAAFSTLFKSEVDWNYETEAQSHLNKRQLYWPRGKMLGGSSSLNAMIYIRGNRRDYDAWQEMGNEGWGFESVLPYFKKSQNQVQGQSDYHGQDGPLNVMDLRSPNALSRAFVEAAVELGFAYNPDFNGAEQDGFGLYQVTQKRGTRQSTAVAFLRPILKRPNLTVETYAHTTRILFAEQADGKPRATAVEFIQNDLRQTVQANKEIILCGGSINSPQLLLLSGIGAAQELQKWQIPVVVDLPGVGQNLQDHPTVPLVYECTRSITLDGAGTALDMALFMLSKSGRLTSNIAEAGGFVRTQSGLDMPDIQYHFTPVYYVDHGFIKPSGHGMSLITTLLHPESRGQICLKSPDPLAHPLIQPHYLTAVTDQQTLLDGLKLARRLMCARAFDHYRGWEYWPGEGVKTDDALQTYIRETTFSLYHPVGTCRMGTDPLAVVDGRLRVYGVSGLRVIDASIMPNIVGGNTNAPTIMIAEKGADLIKNEG